VALAEAGEVIFRRCGGMAALLHFDARRGSALPHQFSQTLTLKLSRAR
jgi:hypothetical protein